MAKQQLPSDTLTRPVRRAPLIAGGILAVALIVGAGFGAHALTLTTATAAAAPTATASATAAPLTAADLISVQAAVDAQQATLAAAQQAAAAALAAQQAAAAQAAHVAAQKQAAAKTTTTAPTRNLPSGAVMPDVPGTNQPDTTACASSAGTTNASGVAVCY